MVFSWDIKQIVKKKYVVAQEDEKEWEQFIKQPGSLYNKDEVLEKEKFEIRKTKKIDLHGFTLSEANKNAKKFIINAYKNGYKKLLIVTGKGLRSKVYNDPYRSQKMNTLKNSVPYFIKNDQNLNDKIIKISQASLKDGGEGAFYIYLK